MFNLGFFSNNHLISDIRIPWLFILNDSSLTAL